MKKYIRVANNLLGIEYLTTCEEHCERIAEFQNIGFDFEGGIIKQADTIPELCDAYVITSKQGHIYDSYGDYGYELKEVLPQAREECPDEDWDLYGCILVDGIIKQVAKMKGVLSNGEIDWELL